MMEEHQKVLILVVSSVQGCTMYCYEVNQYLYCRSKAAHLGPLGHDSYTYSSAHCHLVITFRSVVHFMLWQIHCGGAVGSRVICDLLTKRNIQTHTSKFGLPY